MTTEQDLLRELEAALDVSPSPDFEARVRERGRATSMGAAVDVACRRRRGGDRRPRGDARAQSEGLDT